MNEKSHYPNPYDFVPFKESPCLRSLEDFSSLEQSSVLSGWIEVELKALTPLHIVGEVKTKGHMITRSDFYRQDGCPCIPSSSIRGMLRAFIEAITNGWVSVIHNNLYAREFRKRNRSFFLFDAPQGSGRDEVLGPMLSSHYKPQHESGKLDIATYLFGFVWEQTEKKESAARSSKVSIEDAYIDESALEDGHIPDVNKEAFMGGPHPVATSWWYSAPKAVTEGRRGGAQFIGKSLRGRKFYYHQDPSKVYEYYKGKWPCDDPSSIYAVPTRCARKQTKANFRIYFESVPEPLVKLVCLCLCPNGLRHKLGSGRAYGYGSVEFSITETAFRQEIQGWPVPLSGNVLRVADTEKLDWKWALEASYVDVDSLISLETILHWPPYKGIAFFYPPFSKQNFKQFLAYEDVHRVAKELHICGSSTSSFAVTPSQAVALATKLFACKKTIHFEVYQSNSQLGGVLQSARTSAQKQYKPT